MDRGEGFFVTNKGLEEITKAIEADTKVDIKKVGFGSGATLEDEWDYNLQSLKSSQYEKDLDPLTDTYAVSETDPKCLELKVVVPIGEALTINEIGFFDINNNLIIYGIVRDRVKETVDEFQYNCWIKFDNIDESRVEIVIKSPEFEKVEKLVEDTKEDFDSRLANVTQTVTDIIERAETDFDLAEYAKQSELTELNGKVNNLESKVGETDVSQLKTKVDSINDNVTSIQGQVTQMETDIDNCVTQEQFKKVEENSNKVWHLDPDNPTCQLSDLSSKVESANFGDMYIVSDDNNHAYVFLGKNVSGTVNDGFYDIGGHVDLTNYVTEGEHNTLNERVQQIEEKINVIEPMLTGLDTALEELIGTA